MNEKPFRHNLECPRRLFGSTSRSYNSTFIVVRFVFVYFELDPLARCHVRTPNFFVVFLFFSFSLSNGNHFAVKHLFSIWIPFTTAWCHGLKFGPLFTSSTYRSIGRTVCTVWTHWISKWKTRNHFQHSIELPRWLLVESDFRLNAHSDRSLANDWHFFFFHSYAVCAPLFSHLIRMQSIFTYQSIINNIKRLWCSDPKSDGINFKITAIH